MFAASKQAEVIGQEYPPCWIVRPDSASMTETLGKKLNLRIGDNVRKKYLIPLALCLALFLAACGGPNATQKVHFWGWYVLPGVDANDTSNWIWIEGTGNLTPDSGLSDACPGAWMFGGTFGKPVGLVKCVGHEILPINATPTSHPEPTPGP